MLYAPGLMQIKKKTAAVSAPLLLHAHANPGSRLLTVGGSGSDVRLQNRFDLRVDRFTSIL